MATTLVGERICITIFYKENRNNRIPRKMLLKFHSGIEKTERETTPATPGHSDK